MLKDIKALYNCFLKNVADLLWNCCRCARNKNTALEINNTELRKSESEGHCSKFSFGIQAHVSTATVGENSWMLSERESNIQQVPALAGLGDFPKSCCSHFLFQTIWTVCWNFKG